MNAANYAEKLGTEKQFFDRLQFAASLQRFPENGPYPWLSPKVFKPYKYEPKEWNFNKADEVTPDKKSRAVSTSIRIPYVMVQEHRKVARKKVGIGYQTFLKLWIAERLEKQIA